MQASKHFNWPIVGQYDVIFTGTIKSFAIQIKDNKLINGTKLTNLFYGLQSLEMFNFLPENCSKPCTSMDIKVRVAQSGSNRASRALIDIWKSDQVYVLKAKLLYKWICLSVCNTSFLGFSKLYTHWQKFVKKERFSD